ncbi:MAG: glycosyltransferase [Acidobacteriota bacterium]
MAQSTPPSPMDLAVVVPSVNGLPIVLECLAALRADASVSKLGIELLVIDRCGDDVRRAIHDHFPEATVIAVGRRETIPAMRAVGFRRASAPAVAVIEDHVIVPAGWAGAMVAALRDDGADVVGGGVRNAAVERLVDRAAFLCEYSHLLPPQPAGRVETLTGNNVVYRRAVLDRYRATVDRGHWEDELHAAMRRDHVVLIGRPDIEVGHKMHYRVRDYLAQRFWYARAYAGIKRESMSPSARIIRAIGSVALPPLLLQRIVGRVRRAHVPDASWIPSLPLLSLFVCAWAAGEVVGYLCGGGDALSRVA